MSKTLLIVGGTGFFGKAVINSFYLNRLQKWDIKNLIIVSRNAKKFEKLILKKQKKAIEFIDIDLSKDYSIPECDYIMYFAQSSNAQAYITQSKKSKVDFLNNFKSFIKKINNLKSPMEAILYSSSGAVYGPTSYKKFQEIDDFKSFLQVAHGKGLYSEIKKDSENLFKHGISNIKKKSIARCFAFVGPEIPLNNHFVVGNLIGNIINKKPLVLKSKQKIIRSYLHTEDLVDWLITILLNGNEGCPTYNVGSDDAISIHDLASYLAKKFKLAVDMPKITDTINDYYVPSITKALSIGLSPSRSSVESILKTIDQLYKFK